MLIEQRLETLGIELTDPAPTYAISLSGARYSSYKQAGQLLFLTGITPYRNGQPFMTGIVGQSLTLEQGYEAARAAAINVLSMLKYALGDLDRLAQLVAMTGFVNSSSDFNDQPRVINGASDLFLQVLAEKGELARAAIGCRGLALGHSVELCVTAEVEGRARPPLVKGG